MHFNPLLPLLITFLYSGMKKTLKQELCHFWYYICLEFVINGAWILCFCGIFIFLHTLKYWVGVQRFTSQGEGASLALVGHPSSDGVTIKNALSPKTLKYWVGAQRGQSYLMGRRCLFSLGWPPF